MVRAEGKNPFVEGEFGKERRVRPVEVANPLVAGATTSVDRGVCAPLLGVKFGVDIPAGDSGWRMAPRAGVDINFDTGGNSALFAGAELNKWFERKGFIGTGIDLYDFTHGDTIAPAWLFQGGAKLWQGTGAKEPELHFVISGRLFLDKIDDVQSNYQFFGGLRYIFR